MKITILTGFLVFCASVFASAAEKQMPFRQGEKLVFVLKWVNIPGRQGGS